MKLVAVLETRCGCKQVIPLDRPKPVITILLRSAIRFKDGVAHIEERRVRTFKYIGRHEAFANEFFYYEVEE